MRKALYILGELEDRDLLWLSGAGQVRTLAAGEMLIEAGREVRELYFITDGRLAVATAAGEQIAVLMMGEVVGEMSFVEKRAPGATVTAVETTRVLAIPRDVILAEFERDKAFAARFYRALAVFLSDRLRSAIARDPSVASELDEAILDNVHQAGERFARLVNLLEGRMR